jgi:hypothetical protein
MTDRQFCTPESWSTDNLANALARSSNAKKWILLPRFQRSVVWSDDKRQLFVDSLKNGFPVGALVMYKIGFGEDHEEYSLIDGLQRVNALRDYIGHPTHYVKQAMVPDQLALGIASALGTETENLKKVKESVERWISDRKSFDASDGCTDYDLATALFNEYKCEITVLGLDRMHEILVPFLAGIRTESDISGLALPVLVYQGDKGHLPVIFERLNSQGTQLSKFQVYDATWYPIVVTPKNKEIVSIVKGKYDSMIKKDKVSIEGYDPESATFGRDGLSLSEYLFGLGKLLSKHRPELFGAERDDGALIPESIGFNLVTACLGLEIASMANLPKSLPSLDMSCLEDALLEAVECVSSCLHPFLGLKLNSRRNSPSGTPRVYHTEYQIVSMIACCFRAKYTPSIQLRDDTWKATWKRLRDCLPMHYLFDILAGHRGRVSLRVSDRPEVLGSSSG